MSTHPVENAIKEKLTARLAPVHVEVVNESHMHNVPQNAETHFKVMIVSKEFEDLTLLRVSILKTYQYFTLYIITCIFSVANNSREFYSLTLHNAI